MVKLERIFVVDDDPTSLALVSCVLRRQGYFVTKASSAAEAREKIVSSKPSLILLDMFLPDARGVDLCTEFKSIEELSRVPILFLTGALDNDSLLEAYRSGAVDYIEKPMRKAEVLIRIRSHLKSYHKSNQLLKQAEELRQLQLLKLKNEQGEFVRNLLGGLLHEMNNPLSCIKANVEFIKNRCEKVQLEDSCGCKKKELEMIFECCEDSHADFLRLQDLTTRMIQLESDDEGERMYFHQLLLAAAEMLKNRGGHDYGDAFREMPPYQTKVSSAELVSLLYSLLELIWQSSLQNECDIEQVYSFDLLERDGYLHLRVHAGFAMTALEDALESGSGVSKYILGEYLRTLGGRMDLSFEGESHFLDLYLPAT